MNIFERASRAKLRFGASVGEITVEQAWDLPLTSRGDRPDLDKMARAVNADLKSLEDGRFVNISPDPRKTSLELALDILKHIIDSKLADKAAAEKAADNAERKRKLLSALASKEEAELSGMSKADIEAEIAKLQ